MGRWDNGKIKWISSPLTDKYEDNFITASSVKTGYTHLYVDYVKGTEESMELIIQLDNSDRKVLAAEEGFDNEWYNVVKDGWWACDSTGAVDSSGILTRVDVNVTPFYFPEAGKFRLTIMKWPREHYMRVLVRANTPGAAPGIVGLRWGSCEVSWGGVGQ